MAKNYYDILGVAKSATPEEIKKAYKKQAIKWHPDRHSSESEEKQKEAADKFKEIAEAYDVLQDEQKRAHYDAYGTMDNYGNGYSGPDMSDFFHSMFGGFQHKPQKPATGESVQIRIQLSIRELMQASSVDVSYNVYIRCQHCNGTGGDGIKTCPHCQGTGQSVETQRTPFGIAQQITICPHCKGTGKIIANPCKHCGGEGLILQHKTIKLEFPKNIQHGFGVRYPNLGSEAKDSKFPNGDLIVYFYYKIDNEKFTIDRNNDVYETISIPYYDCILGATCKHSLPTGEVVSITIPKYSQTGDTVKIPHKGIQGSDYYVVIECSLPKKISQKEEDCLKQIQNG